MLPEAGAASISLKGDLDSTHHWLSHRKGYLSIRRQVCVVLEKESKKGLGTVNQRKDHVMSQGLQSQVSPDNMGTCLKKAATPESTIHLTRYELN